MDIQKHGYFISTMLAFWLVISFFSVMGQYHASFTLTSNYVIAFSQTFFDGVAFILFSSTIKTTTGHDKRINSFFCIAMLGLFLSDFFYNTLYLDWFSVSAKDVTLDSNVPLILFFAFMLLGFIYVANSIKTSGFHKVFHLLAALAVIFILVAFFICVPTDVTIAGTTPHVAFSVITLLQTLGILFALIALAKAGTHSMTAIVIGFMAIFFADIFFNIGSKLGKNSTDYILEIIWVLGNVLLASGAYLRKKEHHSVV